MSRVGGIKLRFRAARQISEFIRVDEWASSTIPAVLSGILLCWLQDGSNQNVVGRLFSLACCCGFLAAFLAFGYVVNDCSDYEVDLAAGKDKLIQRLGKRFGVATALALFLGGVIFSFVLSADTVQGVVACLLTYAFGLSYSCGPRFKERGVFGVVVSAAAQRSVPLISLGVMLGLTRSGELWAWAVMMFFNGVRYILVHQLLDSGLDKSVGVNTYALHNGIDLLKLEILASFLIETAMVIRYFLMPVFGMFSGPIAILPLALVALYVLLFFLVWRIVATRFGKSIFFAFDFMAYEALYNCFVPGVLLMVFVVLESPAFLVAAIVLLMLEWERVYSRVSILKYYLFDGDDRRSDKA